ncbi:putative oxidase assembly protein [Cavenderia fasciculata]|uniref:Oxidase assembly protein n=1 Tax=Cavenderia fasciculata TaxID=261658 RepID=F4Q7C6_CACFS|nr:putative oxidase assembly protein [Cavenderia fasciculata]EGG16308.1 putative oxidase assembly protein [Cavenderia fasciculata]|eukprot:XP_004354692.1 putative oxidase assembly protein [Cavenderia fasciculata]
MIKSILNQRLYQSSIRLNHHSSLLNNVNNINQSLFNHKECYNYHSTTSTSKSNVSSSLFKSSSSSPLSLLSSLRLNNNFGGLSSKRCYSTQPSSTTATTTTTSQQPEVTTITMEQLMSILPKDDPSLIEITGLPSLIEVCLNALHTSTGLSWLVIVPVYTLLLRSALFPFAIKQRVNVARIMEIRPQLDEFKRISKENRAKGISNYENSNKITALLKEKKCHPALSYIFPLANLPFFISTILAIRGMAETFPSLKDAGMLWFTDLSIPDSTYILPVTCSVLYLAINELSLAKSDSLILKTLSWFARALSIAIIPFSYTIPNLVYFYWIPSSLFTLGQLFVFKSERMCKLLNAPYFASMAPPIQQIIYTPQSPPPKASSITIESDVNNIQPGRNSHIVKEKFERKKKK